MQDPFAFRPRWWVFLLFAALTALGAIALAGGPHINYPLVPPPAAERAWKELGLAKQYALHASPVERELIEALSHRYANPQPEDRSSPQS